MTKLTDETIKGDCYVSLIRDNEDGSSDFQFNFPPEALVALTRLGILTAIEAGIAEAECLNPDTNLEQDIAITEKNIALMREQQDIELRVCVKEFFDKYLNRREESSGGKMFNPIVVSCCRALMTEPLNNLLARMVQLSGANPKEEYEENSSRHRDNARP